MIHRTLQSALNERSNPCSWYQKVILEIRLQDGTTFYRTYHHNHYEHKCKRCRKASSGHANDHVRRNCMGRHTHPCPQCGNPFTDFTRQHRTKQSGQWVTIKGSWTGNGRNS